MQLVKLFNLKSPISLSVLKVWGFVALIAIGLTSSIGSFAQSTEDEQVEQKIAASVKAIDYAASYTSHYTLGSNGFALLPNLASSVDLLPVLQDTSRKYDSSNQLLGSGLWMNQDQSYSSSDQSRGGSSFNFHGLGGSRTTASLNSFLAPVTITPRADLSIHQNLDSVSQFGLETIEVLPGSSTSINRAGSIGGAVKGLVKARPESPYLYYRGFRTTLDQGDVSQDREFSASWDIGKRASMLLVDDSWTSPTVSSDSSFVDSYYDEFDGLERYQQVPNTHTFVVTTNNASAFKHDFYRGADITANGNTYTGIYEVDDVYDAGFEQGEYSFTTVYETPTLGSLDLANLDIGNYTADDCDTLLNGDRYDASTNACERDQAIYYDGSKAKTSSSNLISFNFLFEKNRVMNIILSSSSTRQRLRRPSTTFIDPVQFSKLPTQGEALVLTDPRLSLSHVDSGDLSLTSCDGYELVGTNGTALTQDYFLQGIDNPTEAQINASLDAVALYEDAIATDNTILCGFTTTDLIGYENATKTWELEGPFATSDFFRTFGTVDYLTRNQFTGWEMYGELSGSTRFVTNAQFEESTWGKSGFGDIYLVEELLEAQEGQAGVGCTYDNGTYTGDEFGCGEFFQLLFEDANYIPETRSSSNQQNRYTRFNHKFSLDFLSSKGADGLHSNWVLGYDLLSETLKSTVDSRTGSDGCEPLSQLNLTWALNSTCQMPWGSLADTGTIKPGSIDRSILSVFGEWRQPKSTDETQEELQISARAEFNLDTSEVLPLLDVYYRRDLSSSLRMFASGSLGGKWADLTQMVGGTTQTGYSFESGNRLIYDTVANRDLNPETSLSGSYKLVWFMPSSYVSGELWYSSVSDAIYAPNQASLVKTYKDAACEGQTVSNLTDSCNSLLSWAYTQGLNNEWAEKGANTTLGSHQDLVYLRSRVMNGPDLTTLGFNLNYGRNFQWLGHEGHLQLNSQILLDASLGTHSHDGINFSGETDLVGSVNRYSSHGSMALATIGASYSGVYNRHQFGLGVQWSSALKDEAYDATVAGSFIMDLNYSWVVPGENAALLFEVNNLNNFQPDVVASGIGLVNGFRAAAGREVKIGFTYDW